jgi:hypothetical protein
MIKQKKGTQKRVSLPLTVAKRTQKKSRRWYATTIQPWVVAITTWLYQILSVSVQT